jgi:CHAD domain-containing protein
METGINLLGEWKANEKNITKNISILRSEINTEAIHDARVAIKKLRAYWELMNELDKSTKNDLPQTKALFDILGKHREWDIILKNLQKSPDDVGELCPLFVAHVHQVKKQISLLIKNMLNEYNINELKDVETRIDDLIKTISLHKVADNSKKIIMRQVLKLEKSSTHFKREPHYTRKLLKVIFYWINLFPPESLYLKNQVKHLNSFLDKLGKWHDSEIVFVKIKNYRKDYLAKSLDEYQVLKKLENEIKARGDKLFSKLKPEVIVEELETFLPN